MSGCCDIWWASISNHNNHKVANGEPSRQLNDWSFEKMRRRRYVHQKPPEWDDVNRYVCRQTFHNLAAKG